MADDEELIRREEERIAKRQQQKNQQYASSVFGGGLQGARLAGSSGTAPPPAKPASVKYGAPVESRAPAPVVSHKPTPVVHHPPVNTSSGLNSGGTHAPKPSYSITSEVVEEPIISAKSAFGTDDDEIARREEERMSRRLGGGAGGAAAHVWSPPPAQPYVPPAHKPEPVHVAPVNPPVHAKKPEPVYSPPPAQAYVAPQPVYTPPPAQPVHKPEPVYQAPPQPYVAPAPVHHAPAPVSHAPPPQAGAKYPEFVIGQLVGSPDGKANCLTISHLGCPVSELYVGTRNNGNSLEFSRKSVHGTDTRVFGLPYQVNAYTTSAVYNPHVNGGEITLRLGKITPVTAGNDDSERELCSYNINGNPSSPHQRVSVNVVQDNQEYYEFLPGPASPYNTLVQVILKGSTLLFRSTYDVQEGGNIITKKVTQTINLPTLPGPDQIETHPAPGGIGSALRIYHRPRTSASQQHVPDTDVPVTQA